MVADVERWFRDSIGGSDEWTGVGWRGELREKGGGVAVRRGMVQRCWDRR